MADEAPRPAVGRLAYPRLPDDIFTKLITDAWTRRAPRQLIKAHQITARAQDYRYRTSRSGVIQATMSATRWPTISAAPRAIIKRAWRSLPPRCAPACD